MLDQQDILTHHFLKRYLRDIQTDPVRHDHRNIFRLHDLKRVGGDRELRDVFNVLCRNRCLRSGTSDAGSMIQCLFQIEWNRLVRGQSFGRFIEIGKRSGIQVPGNVFGGGLLKVQCTRAIRARL